MISAPLAIGAAGILGLIQIRFDDARSRLAGLLDLSRKGY
jgi:hypothetical protein